MKRYVLDSFAVLSYLYNENGAEKIKGVLVQALNDKAEIFISAVNWTEVAYISKRKSGVAVWQTAAPLCRFRFNSNAGSKQLSLRCGGAGPGNGRNCGCFSW
jgi:predicted nucleic acid-binding protein